MVVIWIMTSSFGILYKTLQKQHKTTLSMVYPSAVTIALVGLQVRPVFEIQAKADVVSVDVLG